MKRLFLTGTASGGAWSPIGDVTTWFSCRCCSYGYGKGEFLLVRQKITWLALLGYFAGAAVYILQEMPLH